MSKEKKGKRKKEMNTTRKSKGSFFAAAVFGMFPVLAADCVNASSFGWNAADSTAALQAAFDSGANKVIIDRQAGDWISRPLFITNSNIEVVLADGVTLKAKRGEFYPGGDCLIRITGKVKNIVLRGEGKATLKMNKADYHDPAQKYEHSEWRHAVSILSAEYVKSQETKCHVTSRRVCGRPSSPNAHASPRACAASAGGSGGVSGDASAPPPDGARTCACSRAQVSLPPGRGGPAICCLPLSAFRRT